MLTIKYLGQNLVEVDTVDEDGVQWRYEVRPGDEVTVDDDTADRLLDAGDMWEAPKGHKRKTTKKAPAAPAEKRG